MKSLHERNLFWLSFYTLTYICLSASYLLNLGYSWLHDQQALGMMAEKSPYFIIAAIISVVLTSLIPSRFKATLVFYRLQNPLPGSRIFSKLAKEDERINLKAITRRFGELPTKPGEQNRLWYKIYREVRDQSYIKHAHGRFLLLRDMSVLTLIIPILTVSVCLISSLNIHLAWNFWIYTLGLYFMLTIAANVTGTRFALNVLAEVS